MEYPLLPILSLLNLALVATHAALPPELYWKSVLPNAPMPKAVTDILHPDWVEDKSTSVAVGKGGVNVDAGKRGTSVNVGKGGVNVHAGKGGAGGTNVNVGGKGGGISVSAGQKGKPAYAPFRYTYAAAETQLHDDPKGKPAYAPFRYTYAATETQLHDDPKGKPAYAPFRYTYAAPETQLHDDPKGKPAYAPFRYTYAATETQLHDDPNVALALFFLEKDLRPGTKLDLHFIKNSNAATFLPRRVADSIPFSSDKVEDILNEFSVKPGSEEAEVMKNTINECEEPGIRSEEKYCATSLESMVDFTTSKLGENVEAVSTEADKETELQKYTITPGVKKITGDKAVLCHKQNYPYAVFYCHKTETARAYSVPLEGAGGTRVKAVAVCHTDTSEWNPKHLAFQVLKVKPGTVPVCHFLPEDHVVWVPK